MNKVRLSILLLILAQLACITTIEPYATYPADAPTALTLVPASFLSTEPASGAVYEIPTPQTKCATITAIEALHLRAEPSEKSQVLAYLMNGDQVRLIAKEPRWWTVQAGNKTGWAKAEYLKEQPCQ